MKKIKRHFLYPVTSHPVLGIFEWKMEFHGMEWNRMERFLMGLTKILKFSIQRFHMMDHHICSIPFPSCDDFFSDKIHSIYISVPSGVDFYFDKTSIPFPIHVHSLWYWFFFVLKFLHIYIYIQILVQFHMTMIPSI